MNKSFSCRSVLVDETVHIAGTVENLFQDRFRRVALSQNGAIVGIRFQFGQKRRDDFQLRSFDAAVLADGKGQLGEIGVAVVRVDVAAEDEIAKAVENVGILVFFDAQ